MPKVLRIFNRLILGGPSFNVTYLTKFMEPDFDTTLVVGAKDDHEKIADELIRQYDLHPVEIPSMKREINLLDDYKAYRALRKLIRETKPDIVHTHASKPGTLGRLAAIHEKVPVIVHTFHGHTFHSYFGSLKTKLFIAIEQYLAKHSTRIIAISESQRDELSTEFHICPKEKMSVIPLGLDLSRFSHQQEEKRKQFRTQYGIQDDEVAIGIIGRIVPIKNHMMFVEVIHELLKRTQQKIRVMMIGDGDVREELMNKLTEYQIPYNYFPENQTPAQVTFTSWIHEMDIVYAGLDVVCLTSLNEGTPVSLIEAHAAHKPVVTTNVGGVADIVSDGETGYIVEPQDVQGFTEKLQTLVENNSLRSQFGKTGYTQVYQKYDKMRLVDDMRKLYYALLEKHANK
ncbi:MAG: glycosyltransferase [Chitinophagaceae bacterium]|nr:glycosyltransferase [Chitinophagaceae bacterium]